jgi:hypothetical protein
MAALEASARQRSSRGESVLAPTLVRRLIAAYPRRLASHKAARSRPHPLGNRCLRGGTGRSVTSRRPRHIGTDSQWAGRHSQSDTRPDSTTLRGIATSRCPLAGPARARADAGAGARLNHTAWLTQDVERRGQSSVSSDRCPPGSANPNPRIAAMSGCRAAPYRDRSGRQWKRTRSPHPLTSHSEPSGR